MTAPDAAVPALANAIRHDLTISEAEAQPSPPWGALPAEQYLIRNWDWTSPLPAADQTRTLVRAFLSLDDIPEEWDATPRSGSSTIHRVPTPDEIRTILLPWRPLRYRDAAYQLWAVRYDEAIWLRTYYGEGSDEKFAAWRAMDEDYDPNFEEEHRAWTVLDDRERFDFGDEWWRVFDLLPELAGPNEKYSRRPWWGNEERVRELREGLRRDVEERRRVASAGDGGVLPSEVEAEAAAVLEAEYGVHGQALQEAAVSTFLLVADAQAWETDCLRVLFLDAKGNVVRHSTTDVSDAWETRCYWVNFRFNESSWWVFAHDLLSGRREEGGAELGEKYRARGEVGRSLYGLEL